jgi:hypothetical protein
MAQVERQDRGGAALMQGCRPGVVRNRFSEARAHRVGGLAVVVDLGVGQPIVGGRSGAEGLGHGGGRPIGSMKFLCGNAMPRSVQPWLLRNGTSDRPQQQS